MYQNVEKSLTSKFLASILALAFAAMLALAGCANETAPADNAAGADNAAVEQSADGQCRRVEGDRVGDDARGRGGLLRER